MLSARLFFFPLSSTVTLYSDYGFFPPSFLFFYANSILEENVLLVPHVQLGACLHVATLSYVGRKVTRKPSENACQLGPLLQLPWVPPAPGPHCGTGVTWV